MNFHYCTDTARQRGKKLKRHLCQVTLYLSIAYTYVLTLCSDRSFKIWLYSAGSPYLYIRSSSYSSSPSVFLSAVVEMFLNRRLLANLSRAAPSSEEPSFLFHTDHAFTTGKGRIVAQRHVFKNGLTAGVLLPAACCTDCRTPTAPILEAMFFTFAWQLCCFCYQNIKKL